MRGGRSYVHMDDILQSAPKYIINDIGDKSGDDGVIRFPPARSFPTTQSAFERFECNLEMTIIRQLQSREVMQFCALGIFAK
jgi:hypothetical protein